MNIEDLYREQLLIDFNNLYEKYCWGLRAHEFCYSIIELSISMIFKIAPSRKLAIETLQACILAQGIDWKEFNLNEDL